MAWKDGPLPPDTYNWGGVVVKGDPVGVFQFADFHGDKVFIVPTGRIVLAADILRYDNSIELPAGCTERAIITKK